MQARIVFERGCPAPGRVRPLPRNQETVMTQRTTLALITVALLGLAPLSPAAQHEKEKTSAKAVRHEVADAAEAIKQYGADKRDEAARKAQAALDALDARIEALEARIDRNWDKMDQAAREQARSSLKTLRKQRVEVAEWYGALKNSTAEAWDQMKAGFSGAYTSLRRTWEQAETDNPEGGKP